MRFTFFTFQTDLGLKFLHLGEKTLHILGDEENKSCKSHEYYYYLHVLVF